MTMTRWDFSKSRSSYHFDPTIPEDDDPPFKIVGRVDGDLAYHLGQALQGTNGTPNGFLNRLKVQNGVGDKPFTADMDRAELEHLNLKPDHTFFNNVKPVTDVVAKIRDAFGFAPPAPGQSGGSFHIQKPGMMFPYHVDEIPFVRGNQKDHWLDQNPFAVARLEIMVYDWQPGHVWAYGNTYWKQWKAGDIAWHDWRSTPHGTANIGRTDRATLQITGWTTEQTRQMIRDGNVTIKI